MPYTCKNRNRRNAIRNQPVEPGKPKLNGIDYLEVSKDQTTLVVTFIFDLDSAALTKDNVLIAGGEKIKNIRVVSVEIVSGKLTVRLDKYGDFSTYTLRIVKSATNPVPVENFDPILSTVDFYFKVQCPGDFDCNPVQAAQSEKEQNPLLDYLAKDYASFRQLILDRMAVVMPDWQERNPADLGIVLVEVLAYAADRLSYHQDAVANEACLGTARKRISVRRHARLLDYRMHEGCNARVWVQINPSEGAAGETVVNAGTPLLTRIDGADAAIHPDSADYGRALAQNPFVFETMHKIKLHPENTEFNFYTWGDTDCILPAGSTRATVAGDLTNLDSDAVLILQGLDASDTMAEEQRRHPVRLNRITKFGIDPLPTKKNSDKKGPPEIWEIEWMEEDGLPFDLIISDPGSSGSGLPNAKVLGNIVLADHGRTIASEENGGNGNHVLDPPVVTGTYRPSIEQGPITHCARDDQAEAKSSPASDALVQNPRSALPAVEIEGWSVCRDLLKSDRFARDFVVETSDDGTAYLRFGDDVMGMRPKEGTAFSVSYRVGNGISGNIGAGAIAHIVTTLTGIKSVSNPMPAAGGLNSESLDRVRHHAPHAFRTQDRAVTEEDYTEIVQRHPEVQQAAAILRWTGSWNTMFITVDRKGGKPVDSIFEMRMREFLSRYRIAGHDLEIDGPIFVPLNIVLQVTVKNEYLGTEVRDALFDTFSNTETNQVRGFFHPDNFTFGQPVYMSRIIAAAMEVEGVDWVVVDRFHRWGESPRSELEEGVLECGRLEIARLDNDPNAPQNGRIEFLMSGGL